LNNIHLYNEKGTITKYDSINNILDEYYNVRIDLYKKRKEYLLKILKYELDVNQIKMRFIEDVIGEKIVIYRNKRDKIIQLLVKNNYLMIIDKKLSSNYKNENIKTGFNYLINMPLYHLTGDKIDELKKLLDELQHEYDVLNKQTLEEMWINEINVLIKKLK